MAPASATRLIPFAVILFFLLCAPLVCFHNAPVTVAEDDIESPATSSGTSTAPAVQFDPSGLRQLYETHVVNFIKVKARARKLHDDYLVAGRNTSNVEADAARDEGVDFEEYRWTRQRVETVVHPRRPQDLTKITYIRSDWMLLSHHREELRSVGVVIPNSLDFETGLSRP